MPEKTSHSVENIPNIPMKPADDKIFEKNVDPDMANESDFIKELEASLIKEFEDKEVKNDVVEIKATEGKQLKSNVNEPKVIKEKDVKEEISKPKVIEEEQDIDADENLEEFEFEKLSFKTSKGSSKYYVSKLPIIGNHLTLLNHELPCVS